MSIVYSPFFVRGKLATSLLLWRTFTLSLLNMATHTESHNCTIDAASGRPFIGMMLVCVYVMQLLLGSFPWMGLVSGWMLSHRLLVLKNVRCILCRLLHVE